jgi:hypothetical protein
MRFEEFVHLLGGSGGLKSVEPFGQLLDDFTPMAKPLLWLRLVAYAYICSDYINCAGVAIGFERRELGCEELLKVTGDPEIVNNIALYVERCRAMPRTPL